MQPVGHSRRAAFLFCVLTKTANGELPAVSVKSNPVRDAMMCRQAVRWILVFMLSKIVVFAQSPSFSTFMNPVIPGDHPDCTLTKIGNDFYTTGSSFNPTPVIYHSTDLVHWEAIAQPVSAAWSGYGDAPAGGCWGGQMVYHGNQYWDFFSHNNAMYFVTAPTPGDRGVCRLP